ncbi:GTP 3',8-cyclase MoaA [Flavimobilis soli]|uniref:GTP 3',8-cyclase MoaA n=1 Tax=Flavimobilis soli TaxID=442709 RepID=UPI000BF90C68
MGLGAARIGAAGLGARPALVDGFGRVHRDLRISLTDRCSLRCLYCMPAEGVPWLPKDTLLTTPEMVRIARAAVAAGVREIRLTGGEPLLRPDVVDVVAALAELRAPDDAPDAGTPVELSLTTNGLALPRVADRLVEAGLARVNISIDTLDRERFATLTRRDRLDDVIAGIDAALAAGLAPVKLNAVAMRGVNDDEIVALTRFAVERGCEMRFIEQMPLDAGHVWNRVEMVGGQEILDVLAREFTLTAVGDRGAAPAEKLLLDDGPATVGVIASVTAPFCGSCDRVRLTADGYLRSCLFAREETDLRSVVRSGADDAAIDAALRACLAGKKAGHGIGDPDFEQPDRPMSAIGG